MFFAAGKDTARIKKYTEYQQPCSNCRAFELEVKVFQGYFHLYYIPCLPLKGKRVEISCTNCRETIQLQSLKDHYLGITKTPFWLFSGPIVIILCVILFSILINS